MQESEINAQPIQVDTQPDVDDVQKDNPSNGVTAEEDTKAFITQQLSQLRQEILLLKQEKVKEEQKRLISEAGVPKVIVESVIIMISCRSL